jgi:hypothetical protein
LLIIGHLLDDGRAADSTQRHVSERPHQSQPLRWMQRAPQDWVPWPAVLHRGSQANALTRAMCAIRFLVIRPTASNHQRYWVWGIENNLHWSLDVTFNENQSRLRAGHGAKNMAVVRHFALNLVRQVADKRSIKRRRKRASWDLQYLLEILGPLRC